MFNFKDPANVNIPWMLSKPDAKDQIIISNDTLKEFKEPDILAVEFLYQSYEKELNGVILNEELDFNTYLQVSAFLSAIYKALKNNFFVLILCPDASIIRWHYFMHKYGGFKVVIVTSENSLELNQDTGTVLLVNFTNIKLADNLKEMSFFSVIIDDFDAVATKLVIRKLKGDFNIGITSKNFYVKPNQKLQWTMLNWANAGCVEKLNDFYKLDNENFANLRNNYREWWFRLTWSFSESFVAPSENEKQKFNELLKNWANLHHLPIFKHHQRSKGNERKRKIKANETETKNNEIEIVKNKKNKKEHIENEKMPEEVKLSYSNSSDSDDTIIYEPSINENNTSKKEECLIEDLSNTLEPLALKTENDSRTMSMSSDEEILCTLSGTSNGKHKNGKDKILSNKWDESDIFLRRVASNKKSFNLFDKLLNVSDEEEDMAPKGTKVSSNASMEIDNEDFLKEICQKKGINGVQTNNHETIINSFQDVDTLVEDVYKMIGNCD